MHLRIAEGASRRPARSERVRARPPGRRASHPAVRADPWATRPLRGLRILVVEDDRDSRELLGMMVEALGAHAVLEENGWAAIQALGRERPDLVLCDLIMPAMDGFAFVTEMRSRPQWRAIPVLAVTALGSDTDYRRTWEAGFDAHLTKPVEAVQLAAVIDAVRRRSGGQTP